MLLTCFHIQLVKRVNKSANLQTFALETFHFRKMLVSSSDNSYSLLYLFPHARQRDWGRFDRCIPVFLYSSTGGVLIYKS